MVHAPAALHPQHVHERSSALPSTSYAHSWLSDGRQRAAWCARATHVGRRGRHLGGPCVLAKLKIDPSQYKSEKVKRKNFDHYDEATITVRSGDGGDGEITPAKGGKTVVNFKYRPGGSQPKKIWLPSGDPADGADGSDVILYVDPSLDSLLPLGERKVYRAKHGAAGNPADGSCGPRGTKQRSRVRSPPLRVPVPPGTVVRRKRGGALMGELIHPGDALVVARGGRGGMGVVAPSREANLRRRHRAAPAEGYEAVEVADDNWKLDAAGLPGEEAALTLTLRVVADVGLVGLPNAGKSSLLTALTRARPDIAPYPFTTLTPNLGVYNAAPEEVEGWDSAWGPAPGSERSAVLADLPGLIQGAHMGRGLGRNFLRHLRRTRCLLHVVDAAGTAPADDYRAVREELRMYNPEYCAKPHVVAINKFDLEDAAELRQEILSEIGSAAAQLQKEYGECVAAPVAVVPVSALTGEGLDCLRRELESMLDAVAAASAAAGDGDGPGRYEYDRRVPRATKAPREEEWV